MIIRRYINGKKVDVEVKTSEPIYPQQVNPDATISETPSQPVPPQTPTKYVPPVAVKKKGCGCGRK